MDIWYCDPESKPQNNNPVLRRAIIELNFSQPLIFKSHRFIGEVQCCTPKLNNINGNGIVKHQLELKPIEINDSNKFEWMINHLKKTPEWAIDLEHHDKYSYSGITCLIQIATPTLCFLVDPFHLNTEIKTQLKPLMESGNYLQVFHGSCNDLRWLQRDYDIFAWPVIDTQIIYRKIKTLEGKLNVGNISLVNIVKEYFPSQTVIKSCAYYDDFRERPMPEKMKLYAVQDTAFLLPLLYKLKADSPVIFQYLLKECAVDVAKKALYGGKVYPSAEDDMKNCSTPSNYPNTFKALHDWRSDVAKVEDENPAVILSKGRLCALSNLSKPANLDDIRKITDGCAVKLDVLKIKDIIDKSRYNRFDLCRECDDMIFFPINIPRQPGFHDMQLFVDWQPTCDILDNEIPNTIEKLTRNTAVTKKMSRYAYDTNKYPYSKSKQLGYFSYTPSDLSDFIYEIQKCIRQVKSLLKCWQCCKTLKHGVVVVYCCDYETFCCKKSAYCQKCSQCKMGVDEVIIFEAVPAIIEQCDIFEKAIQGRNCFDRLKSIAAFLRNCEMEIMCNYCFGHLEQVMLVNSTRDMTRLRQCCFGCDHFWMEHYGEAGESIPSYIWNRVVLEFLQTLNICVEKLEHKSTMFGISEESYLPNVYKIHSVKNEHQLNTYDCKVPPLRRKAIAWLKSQQKSSDNRILKNCKYLGKLILPLACSVLIYYKFFSE